MTDLAVLTDDVGILGDEAFDQLDITRFFVIRGLMRIQHVQDLRQRIAEMIAIEIEQELPQGIQLLIGRLVVPERQAGMAGHDAG